MKRFRKKFFKKAIKETQFDHVLPLIINNNKVNKQIIATMTDMFTLWWCVKGVTD